MGPDDKTASPDTQRRPDPHVILPFLIKTKSLAAFREDTNHLLQWEHRFLSTVLVILESKEASEPGKWDSLRLEINGLYGKTRQP